MATTPTTPPRPASSRPTQGSVDPKENPPTSVPSPSGAVVIPTVPPLPATQATGEGELKPVMETGDSEQAAGKAAMNDWKQRAAAEAEAGAAAVQRYASMRLPT